MDKTLLEALSVALDEVYLQSDSAEAGTAASEPPARRGVRVENTVHHALIKHPVGLAVLAGQLGARFSPRVFTAAVLRPLSGVTLSLFSKGNVVLTGARTSLDAWVALHELCFAVHRHFKVPVKVWGFRLHNVVGSASLGYAVDLERMHRENVDACEYEPSRFPGLQYRYHADVRRHQNQPIGKGRKLAVGVFRTGRLIITGAHSFDELVAVFRTSEPLLAQYRC